jgi:hypothetical protein
MGDRHDLFPQESKNFYERRDPARCDIDGPGRGRLDGGDNGLGRILFMQQLDQGIEP